MQHESNGGTLRQALGLGAQTAARLVGNFTLCWVLTAALAVLCALAAGLTAWPEGWPRGLAGAVTVLVLGLMLGTVGAAKIATAWTLARLVRDHALAHVMLDLLFARLLGITADQPQGDPRLAERLRTLPAAALPRTLAGAVASLAQRQPSAGLALLASWLLDQTTRTLLRATVRIFSALARVRCAADGRIDLLAARDELGMALDQQVSAYLRRLAVGGAGALAGALVLLATAVSLLLRWLPPTRYF